jgi:CRP-like cAMP-binding protein
MMARRKGRSDTDTWWAGLCGPVDRRTRRRLGRLGRARTYPAGAVIVEEGARADRFAVIDTGEVAVDAHGREVARLAAGDHFGEVAMLYARPAHPADAPDTLDRTATVRALVDTTVHLLDRAELMTLMDASPLAAQRISRAAMGRLAVVNATPATA